MRKDLPQVLEKVVDGCPNIEEIYLATSALNTERTIRFVDEMMAIASSRLHSFKRFEVQISLDGVDEVHDEVRGIKGFFGRIEKTIAGLRAIQARMPALRIRLSTVILPNNIDDVDNLRRYAAQANLPIQFVPVVISGSYYENEPDKEHILDASNQHGTSTEQSPSDNETTSKVADFFTDLAQTEQSAMRFHYEDLVQMFEGNHRSRQCMMGYYDFVLEHNADIYSCVNCEDYLFGNLLESSFEDVWFGEQATKARNQLRTDCCPTCPSPCHYPPVGVGELVRSRVNALSKRWSNE